MERVRWQRKTDCRMLLLAGGCLLLPTAQAQAHTTFPGLGGFASGFLHPLTTPMHLLVLVAIGLSLGQRSPLRLKESAAVFAGMAALGLILTTAAHIGGVPAPVLISIGLCVGAGVASGLPLPLWTSGLACGLAALMLGLDSGVEATVPAISQANTLAATWVSLVLCLVNIAFYVSLLPAVRWVQVGVRVLGSWIAAIALLLLAFALRH